MNNQTVPEKLGLAFQTLFCEAVKQETAAFVADASPNRKQFPQLKSTAQWNWILAIILHS